MVAAPSARSRDAAVRESASNAADAVTLRRVNDDRQNARELGEELLGLRIARGLSLRTLVALTGGQVSAGAISRYERGDRLPNGATLPLLAELYGVRFVADADGVRVDRAVAEAVQVEQAA